MGEETIRAKPQLRGLELREPGERRSPREVRVGEEALPLAGSNQSRDGLVAEPASLGLRPPYDPVLPASLELAAPDGGCRGVHAVIKSHAGSRECGQPHVCSEKFSVFDNFSESPGDAIVRRATTMVA